MENGNVVTVFVYNIPISMHWKGLWALFGYHGEVVDAFIPTKRCRNGKRFGFVRFSNERDAQRVIMRLNGFFLLGKRIRLKMARYNGRRKFWRKASFQKEQEWSVDLVQEDKSEESFENDAKSEVKIDKRVVQGHVEEEWLWNLQKCLVCESILICDSKSLNDRIAKTGLGEIIVRRIQGRHFLVEIPDEELLDLLRQIEWSYLKDFFIKIEPWSEKLKINERVAWIEVSGVPLHCWKYETFKRVAGLWGKLVSVVSMTVGDDLFLVRVRERGLTELKDDRIKLEIPSEGREIVMSRELLDINLENGNNINVCQRMIEMENKEAAAESISKVIKMGKVDGVDKCLGRPLEEVKDMSLAVVEDLVEVTKDRGFGQLGCCFSGGFGDDGLGLVGVGGSSDGGCGFGFEGGLGLGTGDGCGFGSEGGLGLVTVNGCGFGSEGGLGLGTGGGCGFGSEGGLGLATVGGCGCGFGLGIGGGCGFVSEGGSGLATGGGCGCGFGSGTGGCCGFGSDGEFSGSYGFGSGTGCRFGLGTGGGCGFGSITGDGGCGEMDVT
ncbi:hypothetical protein GOBAR_AA32765 [Gossypium barbadense]|uniref:RRM domain-containing protein n=1 Tax=Gossypium barbadense TaxID=3634 RepID=A0A2P5W9Z7_GOSBA|nr:hypothetical protein GOBAR_AA32765 [Gossypium barbadense]